MDRLRRRFLLYGLGCLLAGWASAGMAEFYRLGLGWVILMLLGLMLGVAWVSDRLTTPPGPSKDATNEPGA